MANEEFFSTASILTSKQSVYNFLSRLRRASTQKLLSLSFQSENQNIIPCIKKLSLAALNLMHYLSHYRYPQTATYSPESCINSWCSSLCRMYVCETERTLRRFVDIIMLYDDIEFPAPPLIELQISEDGRLHSQQ